MRGVLWRRLHAVFISLLRERGFSPETAAQVQSLIGVAILLVRRAPGPRWIVSADDCRGGRVHDFWPGLRVLLAPDPRLMGIAALAIGLTIGAELDIMAYFISRLFGLAVSDACMASPMAG